MEPCYLIHYQIVLHSSEPRATRDKMKFCKLMVQDNGVGTLLFNLLPNCPSFLRATCNEQ